MNKFGGLLVFSLGVFIGSAGTAYFLKKKFDSDLSEEVASVREAYTNLADEKEEVFDRNAETVNDAIKSEKEGSENIQPAGETKTESKTDEPYIIPPGEFNEIYGYESVTLTLYSDGVLADEDMEPVEDVDEIIGKDNLELLEECDTSSVYIRNDSKYCDYEILKSSTPYEAALTSLNMRNVVAYD